MGALGDASTSSYIDGCFDGRKRLLGKYSNIIMDLGGLCGGGGEIRTLGALRHAGFQDRCIRPLCHPSANLTVS